KELGIIVENLGKELPEKIFQVQFFGTVGLGTIRTIAVASVKGMSAVQTVGPPVPDGETSPLLGGLPGLHWFFWVFGQIVVSCLWLRNWRNLYLLYCHIGRQNSCNIPK